jgi:WD40 repeat protein
MSIMGRPEKPLDPDAGPVEEFAFALRELRRAAGRPTYRDLAAASDYSAAALAAASRGDQLPSMAVALAFAEACGGERAEWENRWRKASAEIASAEESGSCPYLGLAAYEERDSERFFGRDRLVADLTAELDRSRFVAVVGPSGSGKSSLLRAGVIPALRRAGECVPVLFTPGADPRAALAKALPDDPRCEPVLVVDQFEEVFTLCSDLGERMEFIDALLSLSAGQGDQPVRVLLGLRGDYYEHCAGHRELARALRSATVLVAPMAPDEMRDAITKPAAAVNVVAHPSLVTTLVAEAGDEPGVLPLVSHALREAWGRRRGRTLTLDAYRSVGGIRGAVAQTAEAVYDELDDEQRELTRRLLLRLITIGEDAQAARRPLDRSDVPGAAGEVLDRLAAARLITLDERTVQLAHEAMITGWPRLHTWVERGRDGIRVHQQLTEAAKAWQEHDEDPGALYRGTRLAVARDWARRDDNEAALTSTERSFLDTSVAAEDTERAAAELRAKRLRMLAAGLAVLLLVAAGAGVVADRQRRLADRRLHEARSRDLAGRATAEVHDDLARAARLAVQAFRAAPTPQARGAVLSLASAPHHTALLDGRTGPVTAVALGGDGRLLAAGGRGTVTLWDVTNGTRRSVLPLTNAAGRPPVEALAFSSDERFVAAAARNDAGWSVQIWNVASRTQVSATQGATQGARKQSMSGERLRIAFSPDAQRIALAADDETVTVWNVAEPGRTRVYRGRSVMNELLYAQGEWLRSVAAHPPRDQTGASASFPFDLFPGYSRAGRVLVTRRADGLTVTEAANRRPLLQLSEADSGPVVRWRLSPDGRTLYTAGRDGTISMWDVPHRSHMLSLAGPAGTVTDLIVGQDGRLLICAADDGTIRIWDRTRMAMVGHSGSVQAVAYSPDGRTLASAGGTDGTVRLWDPVGRTVRTVLRADPDRQVNAIAYSPDATMLAVGGDHSVQWWSIAGPCRTSPCGMYRYDHGAATKSLAFSPDGSRLAAVDTDGTVTLTDVHTHRQTTGRATAAAYQPGIGLALSRGGAVTLGGPHPASLALAGPAITDLAFSPDGNLLATLGQDGAVQLWDARRRRHLGALTGHTAPPETLAFSPDGRLLGTAGRDRTVIVWDVASRRPWATLTGHDETVTSLAFRPDGRTLASASADHTITQWSLDTTAALATLRSDMHPTT